MLFVFFSSKCSLFHNANLFGSCIIHILYTGCAKIKKKFSGTKGLMYEGQSHENVTCAIKFRTTAVKKLTEWEPCSSRPVGRPRPRWLQQVGEDLTV